MLKEVYALIHDRLDAARKAPESACRACAVEELEEVLAIVEEVADIYDEEVK